MSVLESGNQRSLTLAFVPIHSHFQKVVDKEGFEFRDQKELKGISGTQLIKMQLI